MKILFITTTNLATNPRLVKELTLAQEHSFNTTVIQFKLNNWSDELTHQLQKKFASTNFLEIHATKKIFFPWLISSIQEKLFNLFPPSMLTTSKLAISLNKRSYLLERALFKLKIKPDLIIAHSPGSFYPSFKLARNCNSNFAVDIEDYHPGEFTNERQSEKMKNFLLRILPSASYVSYASNLISQQVLKDFEKKEIPLKCSVVIDNVFLKEEFQFQNKIELNENKLNFVWFSQFIDYKRGLEDILPLLDLFSNSVSLTLIGNLRSSFELKEVLSRDYIRVIKPLAQKDLHGILKNFDIGLAMESASFDFNRDLCLTNKIWAYLQSGIYILASPTSAQKEFIRQFNKNGEIISSNQENSKNQIKKLIQIKAEIRKNKSERESINNITNWEMESKKLFQSWKTIR